MKIVECGSDSSNQEGQFLNDIEVEDLESHFGSSEMIFRQKVAV